MHNATSISPSSQHVSPPPLTQPAILHHRYLFTNTVTVSSPSWPAKLNGLSVAHISDLHVTKWTATLRELQTSLESLNADVLAITGDFVSQPRKAIKSLPILLDLLSAVPKQIPIFCTLGNHDPDNLPTLLHNRPLWLRNHCRTIMTRLGELTIAGITQTRRSLSRKHWASTLATLASQEPDLLLAHYPSTANYWPADKSIVQLSGHTHGGQIRLPWIGPIINQDHLPLSQSQGLHRIGKCLVFVTSGIGTSAIPWRFNCPAELSLIQLNNHTRAATP